MKFACFFIYLSSFLASAQNVRVDYYALTKNTVDTSNVRTYLIYDQNNSMFVWNSINNKVEMKVEQDAEGKLQSIRKENDTLGFRVFNEFKNDSIIVYDKIVTDKYIYPEEKVIIWKIINQFKKIGNYKTQMATTSFRGRDFTVWFTEEIPIPSGPWKFYGLPGLILEAKDQFNEVSFTLKSIKKSNQVILPKINSQLELQEITFKEFINKKDNYTQNYTKELLSKLPRGTEAKIIESSSRNGIEKRFEWER